jgi:hypothetical protein
MDVSPLLASDGALCQNKTIRNLSRSRKITNNKCGVCYTDAFGLVRSDVADLRAQISLANTIGENEKADWLKNVLILDNKTMAVDNQGPYSPQDYLNKGKTLEHSSFCSQTVTYFHSNLGFVSPCFIIYSNKSTNQMHQSLRLLPVV